MTAYIVREATPDDAEQLIAYGRTLEGDPGLALEPGEFNYTVEQEREILRNHAHSDNSIFLVAEADGDIIGCLNCTGAKRQAKRHTTALGISVHPQWRGRGVGSALMARAVEWAKSNDAVQRIQFDVYARNEAALGLYRKFGFEVEGRHKRAYFKGGEYIDSLSMALLL